MTCECLVPKFQCNLLSHISHICHTYGHSSPISGHESKHMLIKPLTYLINSSINKGIFPNELKIAKVIPIFKSGDKTSIENY